MKNEDCCSLFICTKNEELGRVLFLLLKKEGLAAKLCPDLLYGEDIPVLVDLDSVSLPERLPTRFIGVTEGACPKDATFPILRRPFLYGELISCVRELMRSVRDMPYFSLSKSEALVLRRGKKLPLSKTEYALFLPLFQSIGHPVSKAELLSAACLTDADSLPVYMHHLRKKLESDGGRYLVSCRGQGYLLKIPDPPLSGTSF